MMNHLLSIYRTALMAAAYSGNVEIAKLLVEKNATINSTNEHGETAYFLSFYYENGIGKLLYDWQNWIIF